MSEEEPATYRRLQETGDVELIDSAIDEVEALLRSLPSDDVKKLFAWNLNLGMLYDTRWDAYSEPEDLEQAIHLTRQALEYSHGAELGDSSRQALYHNLSTFVEKRYDIKGEDDDLLEALSLHERLGESYSITNPMYHTYVSGTSSLLRTKFERFGDVQDLDRSIELLESAIQEGEAEDHDPEELSLCYHSLQISYSTRWKVSKLIDDLNKAIATGEKALQSSSEHHLEYVAFLANVALCLRDRFLVLGNQSDIDSAIGKTERALERTPRRHLDRGIYAENLSLMYMDRCDKLSNLEDLPMARKWAHETLLSTPIQHPGRPDRLSTAASVLSMIYTTIGTGEDLDDAIACMESALALFPKWSQKRSGRLRELSNFYHERYRSQGRTEDRRNAEETLHQALAMEDSQTRPQQPLILHDRALLLAEKNSKASAEIWQEAMDCFQQAANLLEAEGGTELGAVYCNWASTLTDRFFWTGDSGLLDSCIEKAYRAIAFFSPHELNYATVCTVLCRCLCSRYRRCWELRDIEHAVEWGRKALGVSRLNRDFTAAASRSLAKALTEISRRRSRKRQRNEDLTEAIECVERAFESLPEHSLERQPVLSSAAEAYFFRYSLGHTLSDLENAIKLGRDAVEADLNKEESMYQITLGRYLLTRYDNTGEGADLEEATECLVRCLEACPEDHPNCFAIQQLLSQCYERLAVLGVEGASAEFFMMLFGAAKAKNAVPVDMIDVARRIARAAELTDCWSLADLFMDRALDMLPLIGLQGLSRQDQQYLLSDLSGLAADACAVSLKAQVNPGVPLERLDEKDTSTALVALETGRGVIIGLLIDARSDLSGLRRKNPVLADEYESLRLQLGALDQEAQIDMQDNGLYITRRSQALKSLDEKLAKVRATAGMELFLRPQSPADMMRCAGDGAIVVLNGSAAQCDVIVVTRDSITTLHLPDADYHLLIEKSEEIKSFTHKPTFSVVLKKNPVMLEILQWLWRVAVNPAICHARRQLGLDDGVLFRLWWMSTGPFSNLPLHVAGDHSYGSKENALDQVISSYTPTIKALAHSQRKSPPFCKKTLLDLLTVTMAATPRLPSLPGAVEEAEEIRRIGKATKQYSVTELAQPGVSAVMNQLEGSDIVHFVCHGKSEVMDPSQSHLVLLQDQPDAATTCTGENGGFVARSSAKLTVHQISQLNTSKPTLAYLSACSTVSNRSSALADEIIHIASGFQVAGFSHVVGSMWVSVDHICVEMAANFYQGLFVRIKEMRSTSDDGVEKGHCAEEHSIVSAALRDATIAVRNKQREDPLAWAPFIHLGA